MSNPAPKSAIERLEQLEKLAATNQSFQDNVVAALKQTEDAINKIVKQTEQLYRSAYTTQVLTEELKNISALTNFLSESTVALIMSLNEKKIVTEDELRKLVDKNKSSKRLSQETSLSEKGFVKDVEVSERDSLLAIEQLGPNGDVQVERDHLNLQVVEDKFAEKFIGLKVGDSVTMDNGISVKILRILQPVEAASIDVMDVPEVAQSESNAEVPAEQK